MVEKREEREKKRERKNKASKTLRSSDDETLDTIEKISMRRIHKHYGKANFWSSS